MTMEANLKGKKFLTILLLLPGRNIVVVLEQSFQ